MLPRLIFAEMDHRDPITAKVLCALLPKLKRLGYECFFEESQSNTSLKDNVKFHIQQIQLRNIIKSEFETLHLDINSTADQNNYIALMATLAGYQDVNNYIANNYEEYHSFIRFVSLYESSIATLQFYNSLLDNSINYKSIDSDEYKSALEGLTPEGMQMRDKSMATAYLNADIPVFGRIGSSHVEGIQKEILDVAKFSHEYATRAYCFFSIYSSIPNDENQKYISKEKVLPLNLICIDAKTKSEQEIMNIVFREISSRMLPKLNLTFVNAAPVSLARNWLFAEDKLTLAPLSQTNSAAKEDQSQLTKLPALTLTKHGS